MSKKVKETLQAWSKWFSRRLDRGEDYSSYEWDLFGLVMDKWGVDVTSQEAWIMYEVFLGARRFEDVKNSIPHSLGAVTKARAICVTTDGGDKEFLIEFADGTVIRAYDAFGAIKF